MKQSKISLYNLLMCLSESEKAEGPVPRELALGEFSNQVFSGKDYENLEQKEIFLKKEEKKKRRQFEKQMRNRR